MTGPRRAALVLHALLCLGLSRPAYRALEALSADLLCARWDARAEADLAALARDGLPATREALAPAAVVDVGPALASLCDGLRLTPEEAEAVALDVRWRDRPELLIEPGQAPPDEEREDERRLLRPTRYPASRHRELVGAALRRLEPRLAALDALLAGGGGGWVVPLPPPRQRRPRVAPLPLALFDLSLLVGRQPWRGLARKLRLGASRDDSSWPGLHLGDAVAYNAAYRVERLLPAVPLDPGAQGDLERALAALDRPDSIARCLRADLALGLERATPDEPGSLATERLLGPGDFYRWHAGWRKRRVYHEDRARWVDLVARATRAALLPSVPRQRAALEALEAEASESLLSPVRRALWIPCSAWVERHARALARARLARMGLALARAAGGGRLPDEAPLVLDDPYAPGRPLAWRRTGARTGLLWSVGQDGQDDGGVQEDGVRGDVTFTVGLPAE